MIGRTLSHFKITAKLGEGGMGEVYQATDTKLGREVAIKILPQEFTEDGERLARFEREAKTLASLNHPGIVTIHSVEEADGLRFLTMELVTGEDLSRRIPAEGMPLARLFDLAIPLAEALAAAHDRGIVHRDLKPANVMVSEEGRIKVLDFGLAKLRQEEDRIDHTRAKTELLTGEGRMLGTVPYMSPEQLEGRSLDPRSDIFSLGVMLYEMATGERPFRGDSSASLVSSILKDVPRQVDALRPELPHHLGRIVRRCLEKNRERRYQSVKEVHNELTDLRSEIDSGATELRVPAAADAPARRVRWWLAYGLGGLLLLGAAGYGVWRSLPTGASPETSAVGASAVERKLIAVLPLRNLGPAEDEYFAAGITEEIISRLATVRGLGLISSGSTARFRDAEEGPKEIGEELGVDFVLSGSIQWARLADGSSRVKIRPRLIRVEDNVHLWAEVYDRTMEDIFDLQAEIALNVVRELGAALLEVDRSQLESRPTTNQAAYQLYLRGRFGAISTSCSTTRRRIPSLQRAVELEPGFVQAWTVLAQSYASAYGHCAEHAEEDRISGRRALAQAERLAPDSWEVLVAKAQFLTQVERDYERALELLERAGEQISTGEIFLARARIYRRQGRWDDALEGFRRGMELDPLNVNHVSRLAAVHMWMRNYREALEAYGRMIELAPDANQPYFRRAWLYWLWTGGTREARAVLEGLPKSEPSMLVQWAWFWQRIYEKRYQDAIDGLDAVADEPMMQVDLFASPKPLLKAQAYELMGEPELARSSWQAAREILEAEVRKAPKSSKVRHALAIAYAGVGRKADALRTAEEALAMVPIDKEPYFGQSVLQEAALVHTMVGEHDLALDELETLLSIPSVVSIPWLRLDPRWAPLWELPRFRELEAGYG
ncbi:MAG: protein kinase [Acidobacteria bacterium]|nr:protein kinase [Acidobacteriota bacterium]